MTNRQKEMPLIVELKGPTDLSRELIESCETKEDALRLCWVMRRDKSMTLTVAAGRMGLSKAQLSRILDGYAGMRGNQERVIQYLCGNRAIAQFVAWEMGCQLVDHLWEARHMSRRAA